jgi:HEPN domain-containing protein
LAASGTAPPRIHDLRALLAAFPSSPPDLEAGTAESLTPFAVLARYPGFSEQPDVETVNRFEDFAKQCVARLRERVGGTVPPPAS